MILMFYFLTTKNSDFVLLEGDFCSDICTIERKKRGELKDCESD